MKVIGIVGGPRKAGNTVALVEAVLEGARGKGHEAELVKLADLNVGHLVEKRGKVVGPKDDAEALMRKIKEAGAVVFGSPIWYSAWDSRSVAFLDRFYEQEESKTALKGKKAVNCITYAWDKKGAYDDILAWAKRTEEYIGFTVVGGLAAEGTDSKPVSGRADLLAEAKRIGASL